MDLDNMDVQTFMQDMRTAFGGTPPSPTLTISYEDDLPPKPTSKSPTRPGASALIKDRLASIKENASLLKGSAVAKNAPQTSPRTASEEPSRGSRSSQEIVDLDVDTESPNATQSQADQQQQQPFLAEAAQQIPIL